MQPAETLPWSKAELKAETKRASLIVHGRITAYAPPAFNEKEHTGTPEKTSLVIAASLRGPSKAGKSITYLCVCSGEGSSTPEKMVGRDIIVFLSYDAVLHYWKPSSEISQIKYSDTVWKELEAFTLSVK